MPILDTPITTDDANLKRVLEQKLPVLLVLQNGSLDKPLEDALNKAAKKHVGTALIVRVDTTQNPQTHAQYGTPALPALITLPVGGFNGRKAKSRAETIRPADVRLHLEHLLNDTPLPVEAPKTATKAAETPAKGAAPKTVTDGNFREEVLKSKVPVLVDFWAPWCAPCRSIAPYIEQVAKEYQGKLKVVKLNTDENPVMSQRFQVQSIPTFIIFEGGQPVSRNSGANPGMIKRMIEGVVLR